MSKGGKGFVKKRKQKEFFIDILHKFSNNKEVLICRKKPNKRKQNNLKTNLTFSLYQSILDKVKGYTSQRL